MTPFAGFENWDACIEEQMKTYDKKTAEKVCGSLKRDFEGKGVTKARVQQVVKKLLAKGKTLYYADGVEVTMDKARQGGMAMGRKRGSTPVGMLYGIQQRVDAQFRKTGKPVTEAGLFAICKNFVAEMDPNWESWTIQDIKAVNSDARAFLSRMGYSGGNPRDQQVPPVGETKNPSSSTGNVPNQTETNVYDEGAAPMGAPLTKSRSQYGQKLLALKRALKADGLLKQEEIPMAAEITTLDTLPTTPEEHGLNLEERVAGLEAGLLRLTEEVARNAGVQGAAAAQSADAADELQVAAEEASGEVSGMSVPEAVSPVASEPIAARKRALRAKRVEAARKRRAGAGLVEVRPRSAALKSGTAGGAKTWGTITKNSR